MTHVSVPRFSLLIGFMLPLRERFFAWLRPRIRRHTMSFTEGARRLQRLAIAAALAISLGPYPSVAEQERREARAGVGTSADETSPAGPLQAQKQAGLKLREALALALEQSPYLASHSWETRAREARALQVGLLPNPRLAAEVENIAGSGPKSGVESAETTLRLSQLIELGGQAFEAPTAGSARSQALPVGIRSGAPRSDRRDDGGLRRRIGPPGSGPPGERPDSARRGCAARRRRAGARRRRTLDLAPIPSASADTSSDLSIFFIVRAARSNIRPYRLPEVRASARAHAVKFS